MQIEKRLVLSGSYNIELRLDLIIQLSEFGISCYLCYYFVGGIRLIMYLCIVNRKAIHDAKN